MSTPIADMVERMLATGVAHEAIVLAIRTVEASGGQSGGRQVDAAAERRRAWDREYRKNRRKIAISQPGKQTMSSAEASTRQSGGQSSELQLTSLSTEPVCVEKKNTGTARARGTRLAADWQPSETDRQFARDHGVDPDKQLPEFRDFWMAVPGQRGTKLDWSATWRNNIRRLQAFRKPDNRNNVIAAADALVDTMRQWEKTDEPDMLEDLRGGTGASHVRVLPAHGRG